MNLLRKSTIHPDLSAYTHIFGEFDYNRTPLDPPGTRVVINNNLKYRTSWEPHVEPGCYIIPDMDHYRCHKEKITKTRPERISDTVESFPRKFSMPKISSTDATIHAAQDLIHGLKNPAPFSPLATLGNSHNEAFR